FIGVYGLETERDDLPIKTRRALYLMEYQGDSGEANADIIRNDNIYGFSEFCCNNFPGSAFSTVYSYFARKVNKGISDIYYLVDNRKIVSGAVATRYGGNTLYVTFVSTNRRYRRRGLSATVIKHIVASNPGRRIVLMCEKELEPFYNKLGFVHSDNIYLYTLREENI
ncbi:MAG: GNAT family N-acetyltransferase, partial [Oscillospiraceae bacterium]|nr:GNAT family N-acetyltransferase [Oscillospiraceae bacterium]